MTKGDRIRQSSDKELATILTNMVVGFSTNVIQLIISNIDPNEVYRSILKDLNSQDPESKPKLELL